MTRQVLFVFGPCRPDAERRFPWFTLALARKIRMDRAVVNRTGNRRLNFGTSSIHNCDPLSCLTDQLVSYFHTLLSQNHSRAHQRHLSLSNDVTHLHPA